MTVNEENNGVAVAANGMRLTTSTFETLTQENFGFDKRTRVTFFATGLSGSAFNSDTRNDATMDGIITQRLVEMTFASLDEVAGWLTRLGLEVQRREEEVVVAHNPHLDITTAVTATSDPISRAVCLGFAVAGPWWPQLFPAVPETATR